LICVSPSLSQLMDIVYWFKDNVVYGKHAYDPELVKLNSEDLVEKYNAFASSFMQTTVGLAILGIVLAVAGFVLGKIRKKS